MVEFLGLSPTLKVGRTMLLEDYMLKSHLVEFTGLEPESGLLADLGTTNYSSITLPANPKLVEARGVEPLSSSNFLNPSTRIVNNIAY